MARVADWFLAPYRSIEGTNPEEHITLPVPFLVALASRMSERLLSAESSAEQARAKNDALISLACTQGEALRSLSGNVERIASTFEVVAGGPPVECLSPEDAARFLGIKPESLEHLTRQRKIRYVQVGDQRGRVYRLEDLRRFAAERSVPTAEEELRRRGRR
jgi:hypothetical protein